MEQTTTRLNLMVFLMAEVTRLKYDKHHTLVHPAMEKNVRQIFAEQFGGGLTERSKPELFIRAIQVTMNENGLLDRFYRIMGKFSIDPYTMTVLKPTP